jgi:catechol 2,3-dioxygenase-like lactoylglutathione lyase family enzyme
LHHLAFKAKTRAEVDLAYQKLLGIGAVIVAAPRLYPEYHANYYAVFFKDMDNIKFEIVCQSE